MNSVCVVLAPSRNSTHRLQSRNPRQPQACTYISHIEPCEGYVVVAHRPDRRTSLARSNATAVCVALLVVVMPDPTSSACPVVSEPVCVYLDLKQIQEGHDGLVHAQLQLVVRPRYVFLRLDVRHQRPCALLLRVLLARLAQQCQSRTWRRTCPLTPLGCRTSCAASLWCHVLLDAQTQWCSCPLPVL